VRRIGIVSDTHGLLRPEVVEGLRGVEKILHLGDVGRPEILADLAQVAPVHAVRGNVDHGSWARALPHTLVVDLFGGDAYLIHDPGGIDLDPAAAGFSWVLFGHTHRPADERKNGARWVNPGSIGPRRFDLPVSYALLHEDGTLEFRTLES